MNEDTRPWNQRAREIIGQFFTGYATEITGQQLRAKLEAKVGPVENPNAFGPFVASLVRGQEIVTTGKKVKMTGRENHGRLTPVYLI